MKPIARVNDFVVKFANVNGSGSASANGLFAKAILRMGVPVAARNIFPSNIQGLPTWYEVRVVEAGWRGRRGGVDLMVAMNPADLGQGRRRDRARRLPVLRLDQAAAAVEVPRRRHGRSAMPLTEICNADVHAIRGSGSCSRTSSTSARCRRCSTSIPPRSRGCSPSSTRARKRCSSRTARRCTSGATTRSRTSHARSASRSSGATTSATGSSSTATTRRRSARSTAARPSRVVSDHAVVVARRERSRSTAASSASTRRRASKRYAIVQAEDELASIGMVIGAAWNGARAFTATSGPGISLMQEFLGLAYFAEIPAVLFDVQRGSPSTGMPTRTQQADLLSLRLRVARRHQARAAVSRRPDANASRSARRRSTSPTGCRRRSS